MDCKVVWTDPAIDDLESIVTYIGHDDKDAARRVGEDILKTVDLLRAFPLLGPAYPRSGAGDTLEIICWSYRIF